MCQIVNICELRYYPKKGNLEKRFSENLPKEESIVTTENVCRNEEYIFETSRGIEEKETIPAKITILHTKKEKRILAEEDPRKSMYFTHG